MHLEEDAWLDSLEAQPPVRVSLDGAPGAETGSGTGTGTGTGTRTIGVGDGDETYEASVRRRARAHFDPAETAYARREFAELYELRREERHLATQLEALATHESILRDRIRLATLRRDAAVAAERAERMLAESARPRPRWNASGANEGDGRVGEDTRGSSASALALAAAERDHVSRVRAMDALSRWRSHA